jgi:hypothetical protein
MNLLVITYKVDPADPLVGFVTGWLEALAARLRRVDVICPAQGRAALPQNVAVHSLGKERGTSKPRQTVEVCCPSRRGSVRTRAGSRAGTAGSGE